MVIPSEIKLVIIGIVAGFISGLLGIGGGIIFIPFLIYIMKIDQLTAQGTAMTVIFPTAMVGALTYFQAGTLDLGISTYLISASILGVFIGVHFAHKVKIFYLRKSFSIFLMAVAVKMVFF